MKLSAPAPTQVERVVAHVCHVLNGGGYQQGERLPSVRRAALEHDVSKNTMAEAYDRLVARGLLEARPGSGYYVASTGSGPPTRSRPSLREATDVVSLLREQLDQSYEVRPGDGRPPPSWMEGSELRRHFGGFKAFKSDAVDFGYGSSRGYEPLRERLRLMLLERSIGVPIEGLLLTQGANHALDLIVRHMLEPGDTVFVDDPGYYPLFGKLTLAKVQIVGVRRGPDGPDLGDLQAKLAANRPKVFFTQSQAHNPTGGALSLAVAHGLLQAADRWGFRLVEDDAFADLLPASAPRLAALDQLDRVLYVGTFSKTLSASLRCGFIAGSTPTITALADLKTVTVVATSDYVERFVHSLIVGGQYLRHLRRLRSRLTDASAAAVAALRTVGLPTEAAKVSGFYLWTELPGSIDERQLCRDAANERIFLAPGQVFRPDRTASHKAAMRINVAYGADERFLDFLRRHLPGAGAGFPELSRRHDL